MGDATSLLFDLPGLRVIKCMEELGASGRLAVTALALLSRPSMGLATTRVARWRDDFNFNGFYDQPTRQPPRHTCGAGATARNAQDWNRLSMLAQN
jgi:hypothetical protein